MIKAIAGTKDILPDEIEKWLYLERTVRNTFDSFNYGEIRTPIFEETGLFARGIGEATDIVGKEMYTFKESGEKKGITLKPEMTASVVRAFIEHSLGKKLPLNKLFYISPMFRRERPQLGRQRQFHQFGAEALGSNSPALDAEMIIIAMTILRSLGLKDLTLKINSLGIPEERENYKKILRDFLKPNLDKLTSDSRNRFETNVLRILDGKAPQDREIAANAPVLLEHLGDETLEHFENVKRILLSAGIRFEIDAKLVRGLDYYTHTTFEILSGKVGSQNALCGGGRYNLLVEQLGGAPAPGVGFAAGIERILIACENENAFDIPAKRIDLYIARMDKELNEKTYELGLYFRRKGIKTELDYSLRSVKAQMREANRMNSKFVLFVGGEEFLRGKLLLKNMNDGSQVEIGINDLDLVVNKILG